MARAKKVRPPLVPRRIVVTGAAGGVVRQVIISLLHAGYQIRALDRRPKAACARGVDHLIHLSCASIDAQRSGRAPIAGTLVLS